jgi:hypothetical protein
MAKIDVNRSSIPLPNETRNSDSITPAEREARYRKLASADNLIVEEAVLQIRGQYSGMNPISRKPIR